MKQRRGEDERWGGLMIRAQSGDREAYDTLLSELRDVLSQYFSRRVMNPACTDDLVQDVMLAVHKARHTFHPDRSFRTWVFAIAHHKAVDFFRSMRPSKAGETLVREVDADQLPGGADVGGVFAFLSAFSRLPLKQRLVVFYFKVRGMSAKKTADRLGITESDVKVSAHRAQRTLRNELEV